MSEKSNPDATLRDDVQVIRNIFFGEHLQKIQKQLSALEKELSALRKESNALWNELKHEQGKFEKTLRQDFDSQIKEVSKRLLSHEVNQGGLISSLAEALAKQNRIAGG